MSTIYEITIQEHDVIREKKQVMSKKQEATGNAWIDDWLIVTSDSFQIKSNLIYKKTIIYFSVLIFSTTRWWSWYWKKLTKNISWCFAKWNILWNDILNW